MAKKSWFITESELDDFQYRILRRRLDNSFIVKGCAGSGKTILALWRAQEIEEAGLGSYYLIVFTKALRQFIDDGIEAIGISQNRVMHHAQWNKNGAPTADYIIIDEVQDFKPDELKKMQAAAKKAFILFGDSAQQLYKGLKEGLMTIEQIAALTGNPMETLTYNHRLPKKIARIAEYVTDSNDPLEEMCKTEGSTKPFLIELDTVEEQLNFIQETIEEKGYTDVGILFRSNSQVKYADEYFKNQDFKVESKYDINWPDDVKFNLDFNSENPKIMTYHSAKGLQFEAVFLPNCDYEYGDRDYRNPFYVALTRSYQDVYILYSDELSEYLSDVPSELYTEPGTTSDTGYTPF